LFFNMGYHWMWTGNCIFGFHSINAWNSILCLDQV
jgi:hypothetical protein